MIVDVYRGKDRVGTLRLDRSSHNVERTSDKSFSGLIDRAFRSGIDRLRDIVHDGAHSVVREPVKPNEPGFALALIEWLRRRGFEVRIRHPEVDKEIRSILANLPNDQPLKGKILNELPTMSYLEKTFILTKLQEKLGISAMKKQSPKR